MRHKCELIVGCLIALVLLSHGSARAEVVARCGQVYLELIDGYRVLHVKGTPYEMGYQQGKLLSDECHSLFTTLFEGKFKETKIDLLGVRLPIKEAITSIFSMQRKNIPDRYIEEMQGLAAGAGLDEQMVFTAN